jgi:uncharacterized membrane protein
MVSMLAGFVLLANGLAAGVLVGTLLGGWPLLQTLTADGYVRTHAFFASRFDPFMPACLLGTGLGDIVLAVFTPAAPAALHGIAAAMTAATVAISLAKNVPINKQMLALDPDRLPAGLDLGRVRARWGRWNRIRTWLAALALVANCAAVALLI